MDIIVLKSLPNCYGDREQAWDKCAECDFIIKCSRITLEREFKGINIVGY